MEYCSNTGLNTLANFGKIRYNTGSKYMAYRIATIPKYYTVVCTVSSMLHKHEAHCTCTKYHLSKITNPKM